MRIFDHCKFRERSWVQGALFRRKISECKGRQDLYIGALNARLKELEEDILRRLGNVPKNCVISHRD
ncbi:MAG: hypothetical protein BWY50_01816 [Spirochaetes bacterium ADurb.Bin315]|jgi:hypothetical protein|nr:hypothetical protein [Spirochaetales bacterium]OQA41398.1 MAG: hypothetical protein BWY50_01816 [Spirochaetes bacterium ADurb.Bin315]HOE89836.1 hypothetical protein [Sphaerochaeta sp.]